MGAVKRARDAGSASSYTDGPIARLELHPLAKTLEPLFDNHELSDCTLVVEHGKNRRAFHIHKCVSRTCPRPARA